MMMALPVLVTSWASAFSTSSSSVLVRTSSSSYTRVYETAGSSSSTRDQTVGLLIVAAAAAASTFSVTRNLSPTVFLRSVQRTGSSSPSFPDARAFNHRRNTRTTPSLMLTWLRNRPRWGPVLTRFV